MRDQGRSLHKPRQPIRVLWTAGILALIGGALSAWFLTQTALRFALFTRIGRPLPIESVRQGTDAVGATVILEGTVGDRVPLIDAEVYQLRDRTGTLWVVTRDTSLETGQLVKIWGKLRFESIPLEGQEFGEVYVEEERRSPQ